MIKITIIIIIGYLFGHSFDGQTKKRYIYEINPRYGSKCT